jgi:DNA-binding transcriptional LysR family regulator
VVPLGHEDTGSGFDFTPILPGRNIVAARRAIRCCASAGCGPRIWGTFPWVAPLPGSPLFADLHSILASIGMSEPTIRYSGGSLMSVVNYMAECDALAVLPHSVVFAQRREARIGVVPFEVPQPNRTPGVLRHARAARNPAADRLAAHVVTAFEELRHLVKRHETAVVWRR